VRATFFRSFRQVFLLGITRPSAILNELSDRSSLTLAGAVWSLASAAGRAIHRRPNLNEEESFLLKIRLTLMGSKKKPKYRIVVIEKSRARDGRYVDVLGQYDPKKNPATFNLNKEKYAYWVSKGAQPSNTVKCFVAKVS
jgi:small subunit ribosomal protein S16